MERPSAQGIAEAGWERRGGLALTLAPAAGIYRAALGLRRLAFAVGLQRAERVDVPVVSVGNLTVGGTGKTPAALWLAQSLLARGLRPAIVSRGYGGSLGSRILRAAAAGGAPSPGEGTVEDVGDEAVVLASRFAGPVVCGGDRVAAARSAVAKHQADVIVLDDGFQHWRLARDADLVLVDGGSGFGNGSVLPAGPLREPLSALGRATAVVVTKARPNERLAATIARWAPGTPLFAADLVPRCLVGDEGGVLRERPLGEILDRKVVVVSGVARPGPFYDLLGRLEVRTVEVLEFADHHRYTQADWLRISQAAQRADLVVCTEKDLVKLRAFPFARRSLVALRVDFSLSAEHEGALLDLVGSRLRSKSERARKT